MCRRCVQKRLTSRRRKPEGEELRTKRYARGSLQGHSLILPKRIVLESSSMKICGLTTIDDFVSTVTARPKSSDTVRSRRVPKALICTYTLPILHPFSPSTAFLLSELAVITDTFSKDTFPLLPPHLQALVLCLEPRGRGLPLAHVHLRLLQLHAQPRGRLARGLLRGRLGACEILCLLPQLPVLGNQSGVVCNRRKRFGLGLLEGAFRLVALLDGRLERAEGKGEQRGQPSGTRRPA